MANNPMDSPDNLITEVQENIRTNANGIYYLPIGAPNKLVTVFVDTYPLGFGYSTSQQKYFIMPYNNGSNDTMVKMPNTTFSRVVYRYYK